MAVASSVACGPISAKTPTEQPPYIDPDVVSPEDSSLTIFSDETNPQLGVEELYDPNPESGLHYAWYSNRRALRLAEFNVEPTGETKEINGTNYRVFGGVLFDDFADPCSFPADEETLWLYVSDREFRSVGASGVEPARGSFTVSHSWVLHYECND